MIGTPSPYYVASLPPEPLYEQMSASPGYGYVWIDGYWHWNGYEWAWVSGRWERQQEGYVYVQPYYDNVAGSFVYTPGYWSRPEQIQAVLSRNAATDKFTAYVNGVKQFTVPTGPASQAEAA